MILHGDCREMMATLEADSIDSIVTDPPYGLSFMGKGWDHGVPGVEFWVEALRIAKPGAHLLAFGGSRTYHRLACAIEDAGWEVRDCIMWVYGSGFPKNLDVSKTIAKRAGGELQARSAIQWMQKEREKLGLSRAELEIRIFGRSDGNIRNWEDGISLPKPGLWPLIRTALGYKVTPFDEAMERGDEKTGETDGSFGYQSDRKRWEKTRDIREPVTEAAKQWAGWGTALKPAYESIIMARKPLVGTVAQNVLQYGTGGINVDGCRVGDETVKSTLHNGDLMRAMKGEESHSNPMYSMHTGRWPANFIHDGSEKVMELFPNTKTGDLNRVNTGIWQSCGKRDGIGHKGDSGSAARFFYTAKASKADRDGSTHPTMKPTDLMRYLCRLVTPPGGTVLDPFCGSGTTGKGAILEGFNFIGIEREAEYVEIAKARIEWAKKQPKQTKLF